MTAELHTLTGAYAVDALPENERGRFEEHRAECLACRHEVAELQATATLLGELLERTPPVSLRPWVLAEIDRTRQESPAGRRAGSPGRSVDSDPGRRQPRDELVARRSPAPRWSSLLAPAAAVVAIVVLGLSLLVANLSDRIDEVETAAMETMEVLTSPDAGSVTVEGPEGSLARVVMSESMGRAVFLANGMDPAPDEHTYELWLIDGDQARSVGLFDVDDTGRATQLVRGDLQRAGAIGVTVEPAGGSPAPTTEPVMLIDLENA
jgi:anti-sigma-K factor RskA